jgi:hypothetical protein
VAREFKIKVGTLQHILEGYKVAEVMAKDGVGGSTFADWWGYKFEVYDAIPDNAAMMNGQGVVTSVNSDSADLARRLNTEAAKSMKYGGLTPDDALKLVTINPAKQLRIDAKVGSLETGKDADFVVWTANPLSNYARVQQSWIDGRKYFDRAEDTEARKTATAQREALVQKALVERLKEIGPGKDGDSEKKDEKEPPKISAREKHREHELAPIYGDGHDKHTCMEDASE